MSSALEKAKSRLFGDTQPIGGENPELDIATQNNEIDFSSLILFAPTQKIASTQPRPTQQSISQIESQQDTQPIRLPQLDIADIEFASESIPDRQPHELEEDNKSDKGKDIETDENQQLEADITRGTLTDDENELHLYDHDKSVDSSVQKVATTKAELEAIDRALNEEKRHQNIQPAFTKRDDINPLEQLVAAFNSDCENLPHGQPSSDGARDQPHLSPITSPIKSGGKIAIESSDSEEEGEFSNVLEAISAPPPPIQENESRTKGSNPVDAYAERLRRQLLSSPTRHSDDSPCISLEDSEGDDHVGESPVPELTKDQRLVIKQKFARKRLETTKYAMISKFNHLHRSKNQFELYNELKRANARQLAALKKDNGDSELLEEIEREEEEMGTLLEREMGRVRRIRRKEKAQEALQKNGNDDDDDDYNEENGSDVPDSGSEVPDSGSEVPDSGSEVPDSDDEEDNGRKNRRNKRAIVSDDEESEENGKEEIRPRHDDSYMFGSEGPSEEPLHYEQIMQIHARDDDSFQTPNEENTKESYRLFQNLGPTSGTQEDSFIGNDNDSIGNLEAPSFNDLSFGTPASGLPTQADTQNVEKQSLLTQIDDDDEVSPSLVAEGRQKIQENRTQAKEEEEEEEDEEELKARVAAYEAKIRRKELKNRLARKEMERRGIKNIVDGEAEESEDEWKGIGGADREDSDQADSEDEKMIDNTLNIDLNDEEIRKKFMEDYHIKDRKELEKLMDDVKNHKLNKKARGNGFDIELSDEEDELLMQYKRQKLQEQKQRLMANQELQKLAKNEKSKAFFESIHDEVIPVRLEENDDDQEEPVPESVAEEEDPEPKKIVLNEDFVQRQLSFLSKKNDDDDERYNAIQERARKQHGIDSDVEDWRFLKERSVSNLFHSATQEDTQTLKRTIEDVQTDEDEEEEMSLFKRPSIVSSFRSFKEKQGAQVSNGKHFSGVTVNKQYKVASGSKASITYLSKASKANDNNKHVTNGEFKSSRAMQIERDLKQNKSNLRLLRNVGSFE